MRDYEGIGTVINEERIGWDDQRKRWTCYPARRRYDEVEFERGRHNGGKNCQGRCR